MFNPLNKPLIVQSDATILLDVHDPGAEAARRSLAGFAELEKSPEHIHTYRLSQLSLWNAASAGLTSESIIESLNQTSRFPLPTNLIRFIGDTIGRYGSIQLYQTSEDKILYLHPKTHALSAELEAHPKLKNLFYDAELLPKGSIEIMTPNTTPLETKGFYIPLFHRGTIKEVLIRIGYPIQDLAPLRAGAELPIQLNGTLPNGKSFDIRDYQVQAVDAFLGDLQPGTGFGTIVLPCGSGKTIVGLAAMARVGQETLVLTSSTTAVHQWIREIREKTQITPEAVGEYTGGKKEILPVTVATYQILTWRNEANGEYPHFDLLRARNWGLIIYDEVHLLPAPVFRITAELQAVRRLGLTATLIREDGLEREVFSLVGPKRFDIPWKDLEGRGWIAQAECVEYRVDLPEKSLIPYAVADLRQKFRIAAENPRKVEIMHQLLAKHLGESILIIGHYLEQLNLVSKEMNIPILTGKTPQTEREKLFNAFRAGDVKVLAVSKVANFAVDLPDASVAIQISGTFGSRQEEAQRLGRILRPKERHSMFYTLVSRATSEEEFAANRQKFLTEQGYGYRLEVWE